MRRFADSVEQECISVRVSHRDRQPNVESLWKISPALFIFLFLCRIPTS